MDSLAISLQSCSTNYESNSTPVPEIGNQSRNCATGKSLDFNERESHKLRLSDTEASDFPGLSAVKFPLKSTDWCLLWGGGRRREQLKFRRNSRNFGARL
jgi:hypothetical protein